NRGEYIRDKWKKKRRGFIKMHVAVDTRTKKIVSMKVTNEERMFLTAGCYNRSSGKQATS
ncbi:MAG TPA: hypothetical protein VNI77_02415, partial [Nitrososphaera sp.]|nr:hypothetical protein [Nitrososphaera sp.]